MVSQPPVPTPAVRTPTLKEAIEKDLAAEIERGLLAVSESGDRSSISIRDDRQFASGTIEPTAAVQAVVGRIADAVGRTQAHILVRGYADSTPVKPAQFASNKDLSAARAKAVADFMAAKLGARQRVSSEGVGEADPIAPNDTEANRAKNRRISIIVGPQT
jgi:type VI secretion system protein ImpK